MPSLGNSDAIIGDCTNVSLDQSDDQELLDLFERTRESRYLTEIVHRYHPLVTSIVRRHVDNSHDVLDGVQATFLILVSSASKIRRRTLLGPWLHGVAYRTARRIRDRTQRERVMQSTSLESSVISDADEEPVARVTKKMQLDVLDEELQRVRESYRSVLIAHYLLGKSAAQIAASCNLSQSTVEGRLRRGRQQLRMQMLRRGFGFSAAVAVSSQFLRAERATASELTYVVEQLTDCSELSGTDIPATLSKLIAEETRMASLISTRTLLLILVGSMTTICLGTLAMTAVGEQTGPSTITKLAVEAPNNEQAAPLIAPSAGQTTAAATQNGGKTNSLQAWPSPVTDRTHQALRSIVQDIAYNAMPLQQVVDALSDDLNIPIRLDIRGVEEGGVATVDTPVTLNMPPLPLSQVLDYLLSPLDLSYRVEGDVLLISSREKLDRRPNLRVYDCAVFETPDIVTIIEDQVRKIQPQHWTAGLWSINPSENHLLFISASDPAHAEIEGLLVNLARQLGKTLPQPIPQQSAGSEPQQKAPSRAPSANPFGVGNPFRNSADPFR